MNQKNGKNSLGLDVCFEDLENPQPVPVQPNQVKVRLKPGTNQVKTRYKSA